MAASAQSSPGRIFISYRREDTAYPVGWLFDRLVGHFGRDQVFKDMDSIELGEDFVQEINEALAGCDVLLAVIGDRWLTITDEDGERRLDLSGDYVRLEIETALARNVHVIPVLVEGARMPRAGELPSSVAMLARRQALELSPSHFEADIARLIRALDKTVYELRTKGRVDADGTLGVDRAQPDADARQKSDSVEKSGNAAPTSAPISETKDPAAVDDHRTPNLRDMSLDRPAGVAVKSSARSEAESLSRHGSGLQGILRRRWPVWLGILAGTSAGIALVVGLVVNMHTSSNARGHGNPKSSPASIFVDDFCCEENGWRVPSHHASGQYKNGAYHISVNPGYLESALPFTAGTLSPTAPSNLSVQATATRVAGSGDADHYGIMCRVDTYKGTSYLFMIGDKTAEILKDSPGGLDSLKTVPTSAVHVSSANQLRAACTSIDGQRAVHLVFWVNGKKAVEVTDTKNPSTSGSVGIIAGTSGKRIVEVAFDNFIVTS